MAGLCKSVDLPDKNRNAFVEYAAGWWNQVSVTDDSADFTRAKSVLLTVLARNAEALLPGFVERSLRDPGPVGALHFATLLSWVDTLEAPPAYKPATALLILAALAQRRSPYDAVARMIEKFASWKKDLTRDKRVLLALLSAEEVRDYGDSGVAFLSAKSCAALGNDVFVDPADIIAQGARLCTKLATESAIRVMLIVLEPWIVQLENKSPEMLTALFELSELALATSSALRYLVLSIWRACARSCSVHDTLFPFLWGKATPLALQAWRAALEHAEAGAVVRAVLDRVNVLPVEQQASDRVSSVRVEMVLAAVRYGDALKASENDPEILSRVLGHLAHLACVTESIPAMRVLLRFAREKPTSQDPQVMRKQVLAAVTLDQPVMEAACASAVRWVAEEGSNRSLKVASAHFIFELHNAQPAGTRRSCLGKGAVAFIAQCAVDQLRSSAGRPAGATQSLPNGDVPGAQILRELLRFGSCVDLDSDWEAQSVICGLAGACLHPSELDLQLEASLVLRRLASQKERAQARTWFVECAQQSGAEEEDALIQFVAGSERLGVEEIHRVVSGVTDGTRPTESFRALCTLMDVPGSGTFTAGDAFFDVLSAVMQWENASNHKHALEVLSERIGELKLATSVVACRAVRCAMNEFVHGLTGSESDKVLSRLAEGILLQTVGLDDGISPVPGPLSALFSVNIETLLRVIEHLIDSPTSAVPPVPVSRRAVLEESPSVPSSVSPPTIPPSRPQSEEEQITSATRKEEEEEKTERKVFPAQSMEALEEFEMIETLELERLVSVSNVDLEVVEPLPIAPEQRRKPIEPSVAASASARSGEELDRKRKVAMLPIAVEKPSSRPPTDTTKPVSMDDIANNKQQPGASAAVLVAAVAAIEEPRPAALTKAKLTPLDTLHEEQPLSKTSTSAPPPPAATRVLSPRSPLSESGGFFETNHGGSRFETRRSTLDSKRSSSFENLTGVVKRDTQDKLLRSTSPPPPASMLMATNAKLPLRERPLSPSSQPERTKSPDPPKKSGSLEKVPVLGGATPLSPTSARAETVGAVSGRRSSIEKAVVPVLGGATPLSPTSAKTETVGAVRGRRPSLEKAVVVQPPVIAAPVPAKAEPPVTVAPVPTRRSSLENILKNNGGAPEQTTPVVQPPKPAPPAAAAPSSNSAAANNGRRALPGMAELSQLKHAKARTEETTTSSAEAKDVKLEHHSLERPLIPVGKRRRPTVTSSQASSSSSTL